MGIFGNLDMSAVSIGGDGSLAKVGLILLVVFLFVVISIVTFFIIYNKQEKKKYKYTVFFAQTFKGKTFFVDEDKAKEVTIPGTNIKVFYLKKMKTWVPKLARPIGKNTFLLWVSDGGEWVNTPLSAFDGEKLGLDNESRPNMDYANENLKDIINRNFKDKAIKWWKEYSHLIGFLIITVILVVAILIIFSRFGKLIGGLGVSSQNFKEGAEASREAVRLMAEYLTDTCVTSGVRPA